VEVGSILLPVRALRRLRKLSLYLCFLSLICTFGRENAMHPAGRPATMTVANWAPVRQRRGLHCAASLAQITFFAV